MQIPSVIGGADATFLSLQCNIDPLKVKLVAHEYRIAGYEAFYHAVAGGCRCRWPEPFRRLDAFVGLSISGSDFRCDLGARTPNEIAHHD